MWCVRRWALMPLVLLIVATSAQVVLPQARAAVRAQVSAPAPLKYACAQKSTGVLKYVSSPAKCAYTGKSPSQTLITISSDLHYVCVHADNSVYLVGSLSSCAIPKNRAALTLPPATTPDYFCAAKVGGALSYAAAPGKCQPRSRSAPASPSARLMSYPVAYAVPPGAGGFAERPQE
jgi:hypothetical protein